MSNDDPFGTPPEKPEWEEPKSPQQPPQAPQWEQPKWDAPQQPPQQFGNQFGGSQQPPVDVPDYLVWSIILTVISVLCCVVLSPFGIIGIVFSAKANSNKAIGNYQEALSNSALAKKMCWIGSIVVGVVALAVIAFYAFAIIGSAVSES